MTVSKAALDQAVGAFEGALEQGLRRLWPARTGGLVAVSGGPDSMALMYGLTRLSGAGARFEVMCVDHGLRAEAADEVQLVRGAAEALGLAFHTQRVELGEAAAAVEARARHARYAALEAVRAARGLDAVLTAHTANDQAETVLMRLARGSALGGAAGILGARGDRVVRPLLFVTRAMVEAYVEALGVVCTNDPMNADPSFLRVRVRREVLPALEAAAGPGTAQALARFAAYAAEDDAFISSMMEDVWRALRARPPHDGTLDAEALVQLPRALARRVMARFLEEEGLPLDSATVEEALVAVAERRRATLPLDKVLSSSNGRVWVEPSPPRRLHTNSQPDPGRHEG